MPFTKVAVAAVLAWLWIPASAGATTYCVMHTGVCPTGQTQEGSVQAALTAAAADLPGPNIVQIGPGTYHAAGAGFDYSAPGAPAVSIVGVGQGQTTLDSSSGSAFILRLAIAGSSVTDLSVSLRSPTDTGLILGADATLARRVTVVGTGSLGSADGVQLDGAATFADGTVTLPDSSHADIEQESGATGRVSGSYLTGSVGLMTAHSDHPALAAGDVVISASQNAALVGDTGTMTVDTALMLMRGALPIALSSANGSLTVHSATLVSLNGGGFAGSVMGSDHSSASLTLQDSIVHGFAFLFTRGTSGPGTAANLTAQYDDLHLTGPGSGSGAGAVTLDHNINADPTFVNPAASDYRLLARSPAIDAGGLCDAVCLSTPDLDGLPLPIDGDGDGISTRDLGPYEYGHHAPTAEPSGVDGVTAGAPVPFDGSASPDPDDGDQLTYAWTFDDGATASGAHVQHAFATAGLHRASLTVTDPTGLSSTAGTTIEVVSRPIAPLPTRHRTRPIVSDLTLTPSTFAVGARVTAVSARSHAPASPVGSSLRFELSETSAVTIALGRVVRGHESHGHCLTSARRGRACSVVQPAGTLRRSAVRGGRVTIAFSGRVGRRSLSAGHYIATVIATDTVGDVSRPARARFTIVAG